MVGALGSSVGIFLLIWFTSAGLLKEYSYWYDELVSVTASNSSLGRMFDFAFSDVHPPLYQFILWLWISVFGDTEFATRSLSTIFVAASLISLISLRRVIANELIALTFFFFTLNPLTFFYAQETRSYGLLLLLSTVAMVAALKDNRAHTLVWCVLLGLSHFFGTLLALLILGQMIWRCPTRNTIGYAVLVSVAIILWPTSQLLFGEAAQRLGGNFWITTGPLRSLSQGVSAAWPAVFKPIQFFLMRLGIGLNIADLLATTTILSVLIGITAFVRRHRANSGKNEWKAFFYVTGLMAATLTAVALISIYTPISTQRNYIILVPYGSFAAAILTRRLMLFHNAAFVLVTTFCVFYALSSFLIIEKRIGEKTQPLQDWRGLSRLAFDISSREELPLLHLGDRGTWSPLYSYYLPDRIESKGVDWQDHTTLPTAFVLMYGHTSCSRLDRIKDTLTGRGQRFEIVEMKQTADCSFGTNGIIVAK